jgi:hypothetical protein
MAKSTTPDNLPWPSPPTIHSPSSTLKHRVLGYPDPQSTMAAGRDISNNDIKCQLPPAKIWGTFKHHRQSCLLLRKTWVSHLSS